MSRLKMIWPCLNKWVVREGEVPCTNTVPRMPTNVGYKPGGSELCQDCQADVLDRIASARSTVVARKDKRSAGRRQRQAKEREFQPRIFRAKIK